MRWLLYLMFFYATYRFFRILSRRIAFTLFQQPRNSSRSGSQSGAQGRTGSRSQGDARSGARYRAGGFQRGGAFRNQSRNGKPNFDTIEEAEFEDITENTSGSST